MNFQEILSKSYASSLSIERSWGTQSKELDRPVSNAPNAITLSTLFFHFAIIVIKQFPAL